MPYTREYRVVPKEAIYHYAETNDIFMAHDDRGTPAHPTFRGLVFAQSDGAKTVADPGEQDNSLTVGVGSRVNAINYDVQIRNYTEGSGTINGMALYVWPLSIDDAEAEILSIYAPTFFEKTADKFNVKSVINKTWSQVMAEMLKPEVRKILGQPIQFLPTSISDSEKFKTISVPQRLKTMRKFHYHGWAMYFDSRQTLGDGDTNYNGVFIDYKVIFNEYLP